MFGLDQIIVTFINSFANRSWTLDTIVVYFATNYFIKGGVIMMVFWWAWFRSLEKRGTVRGTQSAELLLYTIFICVPTLLAARTVAAVLPFRQRPLLNPQLHLRSAMGLDSGRLERWSSFPSDHAVLFFLLATGFFLVSRRTGLFVYVYSALCICFPRIFLGIHYPTDILAGALFGVACAATGKFSRWRSWVTGPALNMLDRSPGWFYAGLFFLTFQTAEMYDPLLGAGHGAWRLLHVWFS